ncbi:uncharacterized protein LOC132062284 [Lycium ferocissimum]|uniref:uncharacterized protein LOC132062284 n=1 Tax=Lycium ferocissimum TaxID=112874 RepID=UPI002816607F|nr:uncharacterized protein LOC132062284 [Lycium ferocissimum]
MMKKSGYGLQLRAPPSQQKKKQPARPPVPAALGFGDYDDDVEKEISRHASKNKALKDNKPPVAGIYNLKRFLPRNKEDFVFHEKKKKRNDDLTEENWSEEDLGGRKKVLGGRKKDLVHFGRERRSEKGAGWSEGHIGAVRERSERRKFFLRNWSYILLLLVTFSLFTSSFSIISRICYHFVYWMIALISPPLLEGNETYCHNFAPFLNCYTWFQPKYIQMLMEKAKQREREHEVIYERKIAKERSKDDHLYADKDKFVTAAYKRKLQEQAKWLEEERLRELREERDDVTKKSDISDFYFSIAKNVAFGGESKSKKAVNHHEQEAVQTEEKPSSSADAHSQMSREIKRQDHEPSASPPHKERTDQADMKPPSDRSSEERAGKQVSENGPTADSVSDQPKVDHHKRSLDAVAAAKERFLARKRAKEADLLSSYI